MQIILQGEEDFLKIRGQYIVMLNKSKPHADIKTPFYLEKRIRHVSKYMDEGYFTNGMFYSEKFDTWKELEHHINNHETRFYRFMTKDEIKWLVEQMYELRETR